MKKIKRLSILLIALVLTFSLFSCKGKNNDGDKDEPVDQELTDEQLVNSVIESVEVPRKVHQGLDLPSEVNGVMIEWTSEETLAFDKNQQFYVNSKSEYSFIIYATFTYSDLEISKTYQVAVESKNDGIANAAWDIYKKKIPTETIKSFALQKKEINGCSVRYQSFNTDVISNDGEVKQYNTDKEVLFTTYITTSDFIVIYPTTIKVAQFTNAQRIESTVSYVEEHVKQIELAETIQLPSYCEEYDTYINWYSLSFGLISSTGIIIRPINKTDVSIGCTIVRGEDSRTLQFKLTDFGGNITMEEQLKLWADGNLPINLKGTKNYVGADDHLTEQVRTNSYGVLNMISGAPIEINREYYVDHTSSAIRNKLFGSGKFNTNVHPSVPQSVLDELFYEGYKMPNEQNILWIVVHESGMPRKGQNAELLAQLQYNNAFTSTSPREASWHYQVDEGKIYQSFDDSVVCWHAGDGTASYATGNNNGIGIEMCINDDGNYDGAMHMDAKLVAYLLHKYNLTMENVKRHYDFSGKICPNYMINTGRWTEFLELVNREYMAYKYYNEGVKITFTVTDEKNTPSQEVLNKYFIEGVNGLYFNKPVEVATTLIVEIKIEYNQSVYTKKKEITLKPAGE